MTEALTKPVSPRLLLVLIYAALSTAIVSSLGMLLVPTISAEMDVSMSTAQWMLTVNLLVGAIATPIMGRLSDGPHKKGLLVGSLIIILAGSIIAALATNFTLFLVGRALQGLTYGIVPVAISLARRYLPAEKVTGGIASLSVTVATGIGVGYPLTGIIAGAFEYQYAFWFAVLFVISALIVVIAAVPAGPDAQAPNSKLDTPGAALLGLGLICLLLGLSEGANWGWAAPGTLGGFVLAAILLAIWVRLELRVAHPLINLRVLRSPDALIANLAAFTLGTVMYMALSMGSIIAQAPQDTGYGIALPVFWAGFVMFPLSVGSFAANRLVHMLTRRISLMTMLPIGAAVITASSVFLWLAHDELWQVLASMLLIGIGIGATYAAMPALIARSVIAAELGSAVSFNQVLRTIGGSFGTAISGAVLAANMGTGGHPTSHGIQVALAISAIGCGLIFIGLVFDRLLAQRRRTS